MSALHPSRRSIPGALVVAVTCALLTWSRPAQADEAGVSSYVSDQFKTIAKRIVRQVVTDRLRDVCTKDSLICSTIVDRLLEALEGALDGDLDRVKASLSSFFVESSVTTGAAFLLKDLFAQGPPQLNLAKAQAARFQDALLPLGRCALEILKDGRKGCSLDKAVARALEPLRDQAQGGDVAAIQRLIDAIDNKAAPSTADAFIALEALASVAHREDLRVYLDGLKRAVADGMEAGIYGVALRFFNDSDALIDDLRAGGTVNLFGADFKAAFDTCGLSTQWTTWESQRADLEDRARRFARRQSQDLATVTTPLETAVAWPCDSTTLDAFRTQVRFLIGSLELQSFRSSHGLALIAIGAVLDLVRTGDQAKFELDVRELIAQAIDEIGLSMCNVVSDAKVAQLGQLAASDTVKGCYVAAGPTHRVCQTAFLSELVRGGDPATVAPCYDAIERKECATLVATPPPANPSPGACYFPELAVVARSPSSETERRAKMAEVIAEYVERAGLDPKVEAAIVKAVRFIGDGDAKAARKTLTRLAVELLLDYVKTSIEEQLGASGRSCEEDVHSTTIFNSLDAKCAVVVLVEAAYYPIADYLWDGGLDAANASQVANSAYKAILSSKALAGAPLILNLGLGANLVWGKTETWGDDPYRALTVVDKFGIALYRYRWDKWTFQSGLFVGGFLDALVRAVDGDDRKYWLTGATIGFPRMFGVDFGVEVHAALALPFEFEWKRRGYALGVVVVIPWDYWKED